MDHLSSMPHNIKSSITIFLTFFHFERLFVVNKAWSSFGATDFVWIRETKRAVERYDYHPGYSNNSSMTLKKLAMLSNKEQALDLLASLFYICVSCEDKQRSTHRKTKSPGPGWHLRCRRHQIILQGPLCFACWGSAADCFDELPEDYCWECEEDLQLDKVERKMKKKEDKDDPDWRPNKKRRLGGQGDY